MLKQQQQIYGIFKQFQGLIGSCSLQYAFSSSPQDALMAYEIVSPNLTNKKEVILEKDTNVGIFMHGMLGQGKNWRSFSRSLVRDLEKQYNQKFCAILVDLRNHGDSQTFQFPPPSNLQTCSKDLENLIKILDINPVFLAGHSFGGKVLLEFLKQRKKSQQQSNIQSKTYSQQYNKWKNLSAWVLDSQPGVVKVNGDEQMSQIIKILKKLPETIPNRQWFYDFTQKENGLSTSVSQWLAGNLVELDNKAQKSELKLTLNVQEAEDLYAAYLNADLWDVFQEPPAQTSVHLVRAEKSDRWDKKQLRELEQVNQQAKEQFSYHLLPNASHWLQVDNPRKLLEVMHEGIVKDISP